MEKMPVFVRIEEYQDVLSLIRTIEHKIDDSKNTLLKINDLKTEEDDLIGRWQQGLTEVEKKVEFINNSLNEPERY